MSPYPRRPGSALLLAALLVLPGRSAADAPAQRPVFRSGQGGYHTYRIPALLVSPRGTLLAFCEGRKHGAGDSGDIALLLKRSRDGGRTRDRTQVVWDRGEAPAATPAPSSSARPAPSGC
jgi:sialidase-1